MITKIVISMLTALSLTIIIEVSIGYLLKIRDKMDILHVVLINGITNPVINCLLMIINYLFRLSNILYYSIVLILEIIVVYVEYKYYEKNLIYKRINLLSFSFILNASSFILGLIILKIVK